MSISKFAASYEKQMSIFAFAASYEKQMSIFHACMGTAVRRLIA